MKIFQHLVLPIFTTWCSCFLILLFHHHIHPTSASFATVTATTATASSSTDAINLNIITQSERTLEVQTLISQLSNFTRTYPGYAVVLNRAPQSTTDLFKLILNTYLAPHSQSLDVFPSDVIWTDDLRSHLLDLSSLPGFSSTPTSSTSTSPLINTSDFESHAIANVLSSEGALLGVPWFTDYPLLYYRKDLLMKYFNSSRPPATWDELEAMSEVIQDGERMGDEENGGTGAIPDFWGFIWQGKAYEGLTCNVLEWINSHGGGTMVDPLTNRITLNNPYALKALVRAQNWVGNITPYTVLGTDETSAQNLWAAGKVAFMRNWLYAIAESNQVASLRGRFGVAPLPCDNSTTGSDDSEVTPCKHSGTLGGWNLAVSKYSVHPAEAAELVAFLSSPSQQIFRYQQQSSFPTLNSVRNGPELCGGGGSDEEVVTPCDASLPSDYIIVRPSTAAFGDGKSYADLSRIVYTSVNSFLISNSVTLGTVNNFLLQLECDIASLLYGADSSDSAAVAAADRMPLNCITDRSASMWVVVLSATVAFIGLVLASLTVAFVVTAWTSHVIKASSQVFMMVLSVGILWSFVYQLLLVGVAALPQRFAWVCYASPFVAGLAFTTVVGSLTLKTFQIWFLLKTAKKLDPRVIPHHHLLQALLALFTVDGLISAVWMGVAPPVLSRIPSAGDPALTFVYKCSGSGSPFWLSQVVWRALVLGVATVMAIRSRNIPTIFNESRSTGFVIYNAAFLGLLYTTLRSVVEHNVDYDLLLQVLCISVTMYIAVALCFGTKFYTWWNKSDEEVRRNIIMQTRNRDDDSVEERYRHLPKTLKQQQEQEQQQRLTQTSPPAFTNE